jgi:hypothetical protein
MYEEAIADSSLIEFMGVLEVTPCRPEVLTFERSCNILSMQRCPAVVEQDDGRYRRSRLAVNRDKPDRWKADIAQSVDLYNDWFIEFAPKAFRDTRGQTTSDVEDTLKITNNLTSIGPEVLRRHPGMLSTLRMSTCPPLARDRLIGLTGVPKSMVERMERKNKLPTRLTEADLDRELQKIKSIVEKLADRDIFTWLDSSRVPMESEVHRAATIIADRLCGARANPIVRNAQEARQLRRVGEWLDARGYRFLPPGSGVKFDEMSPGTYGFRINVPVRQEDSGEESLNVPVDVVIMRRIAKPGDLPLLIEAKSAGDFTNVNKRRKEEAKKADQLRRTYGEHVKYVLFLCGYFDTGYLGYEAAEGIDWVWEHRISDLAEFGV